MTIWLLLEAISRQAAPHLHIRCDMLHLEQQLSTRLLWHHMQRKQQRKQQQRQMRRPCISRTWILVESTLWIRCVPIEFALHGPASYASMPGCCCQLTVISWMGSVQGKH